MGADCGECARGYVRVEEHCVPHARRVEAPWYRTLHWLWLLLLLLCCCCCTCGVRSQAADDESPHFQPSVQDILLLAEVKTARPPSGKFVDRDVLTRPDMMMKGRRARRASIAATPRPIAEGSRMRTLTAGNAVWPGRRAASFDGHAQGHLIEVYGDGRPRQRWDLAYTDDCSGAHSSVGCSHRACESPDMQLFAPAPVRLLYQAFERVLMTVQRWTSSA